MLTVLITEAFLLTMYSLSSVLNTYCQILMDVHIFMNICIDPLCLNLHRCRLSREICQICIIRGARLLLSSHLPSLFHVFTECTEGAEKIWMGLHVVKLCKTKQWKLPDYSLSLFLQTFTLRSCFSLTQLSFAFIVKSTLLKVLFCIPF